MHSLQVTEATRSLILKTSTKILSRYLWINKIIHVPVTTLRPAHPLFSNFCSSSSLLTSLRPTIFCTVCDSFCMTDWLLFSRCMHCKSRGSVTNGGLIHYPKYSLPPLPRSDSGCHHSQTFFFTRRYHGHQLKLIALLGGITAPLLASSRFVAEVNTVKLLPIGNYNVVATVYHGHLIDHCWMQACSPHQFE